MKKHFNLFFIFLEDQKNHPMPKKISDLIRKRVNDFFERRKYLDLKNDHRQGR